MYLAAILVPAYLLGSIPFGLLLDKIAGSGDLRQTGSGNIGATNVLRTGRRDLAALTLLLDAGKGACATLLASRFGAEPAAWGALAAVAGHMFPVWLAFRGGKGVATAFGAWAALAWPVAALSGALWLVLVAAFRKSSVGAIGALVLGAPLLLWGMLELQLTGRLPLNLPGDPSHLTTAVVISVLVLLRHHANIRRLLAGTEPELTRGSK